MADALTPEGLRAARRKAGLTQSAVAARMGTTQSAVARWERGAVSPSLEATGRFADAVGCALALSPLTDAGRDDIVLEPDERARLQMNLRRTPQQRLAQLTNAVRFSRAGRRAMAAARAHA